MPKKYKSGAMMIEVLFQMAIAMALIFCFVSLWQPFIRKINVDYMAKTIVRSIEANGRIDSNIYDLQNQLEAELGFSPNVTYSAEYLNGTNKIQIRKKFKVTITDVVKIKLITPSFGDPITVDIPIKKELTGISQVFWKG